MSGLGSRSTSLERLARSARGQPLDLLVVGGGITGAGIALDAASRGMKVGLVERADFASGTSSKSSKLVHGGLRYLEQREFGLVREASVERDLMLRLAPHLVEPIPFVLPVSGRTMRAKFGAGLWAYDALASFRKLRVHKHLGRDETERLVPPLPPGKVTGGYLFYDCRTDDTRLVLEVLVQAVRYGAVVANYAPVTDLSGSDGTCRAEVQDLSTGDGLSIDAKRIVVAAGVWSDRVESLAVPGARARLRPSKGIHLVFSKRAIPIAESAVFIPDASRRRMVFVIPWLGSVLVGTTDTAYEGELDIPVVEKEDRAYCLAAVNAAFDLTLADADVAGAFAGLRPLVAGVADETADLSRRHAVFDIAPGIRGITGGKLTTWRRMARDATDRVTSDLGIGTKCKTHWIRLGSSSVHALTVALEGPAARMKLERATIDHLVRCYGDRALRVLDLARDEGLGQPLVAGRPEIAAEAFYCSEAEMVVTLSDLLSRRTRLSLTDPAAGIGSSGTAASFLARAIGWSGEELRRQVRHHRLAVERERGMPLGPEEAPAGPEARAGTG